MKSSHPKQPMIRSDKYSQRKQCRGGTRTRREGLEGTEPDKSISWQTILHLKVSTTAGTLAPCSCPHLSHLLCLHTVHPQLPLTFPGRPLRFTINHLTNTHNACDQNHIQNPNCGNLFLITTFHFSVLVQARPARKYKHQTGAAVILSETTIKKHLVSCL